MQTPTPEEIGKIQRLIMKNPTAFVAAVFFTMFGVTYFINLRQVTHREEHWKELYLDEKKAKDELNKQLLIKAGIIEAQNKIINQADTILRNETSTKAVELLNSK